MYTQEGSLSNSQSKYLETFINRYTERTKNSKKFRQVYRSVIAEPLISELLDVSTREMYYPIIIERSLGSRVWDIDENEYIDFIMGPGVNLFGHNPPFIKKALQEQLEKGMHIGLQSQLVGEVAQLICELTGMERVAFSNTGTEAVMTAIRLARAATGRKKIVIFSGSYHGHFDGTQAQTQIKDGNLLTSPIAPGIIPNFVEDVLVLNYGDPKSLDIIKSTTQELAAVLVEPVQSRRINLQPKEFLQQLRQLTQALGIVLIFDEMVTGFRIHPGGAQAWFGIQADIATYGKIVGGGMPIGIIAGKANYLDRIDGGMWNYGDTSSPKIETTIFAGTFRKHPLTMAAALSVLKHLKTQGCELQQQLNQRTYELVNKLNTIFAENEMLISFSNFGSLFGLTSLGSSAQLKDYSYWTGLKLLIIYHLRSKGIILFESGNGYLSTAHTDEDIDYLIQTFKHSVEDLKQAGFFASSSAHFAIA
ncbi:MAG: aspartate aminotransferase family protein [Nostoc sp.]|uniref:aspartate aminotransferase family protein n=1 Tax=Nostoc sp. TaxID=1180 RepID=UPI002FEFB375